jgi:hypothetical protein
MNCKVEQRGIGKPMLVMDISVGFDCSHWGLTDLYPECEKNLRDLLKTGADFETEWCNSKKELLSARYRRENGSVWVDVNQWMDDLWEEGDLIVDAMCDLGVELDSDGFEYVRRIASEMEIDDAIAISEEVGEDATYEDCMEMVTRLMDKTDAQLNEWYTELRNIVEDCAKTQKGE